MASSEIPDSIPLESWVHPKFLETKSMSYSLKSLKGVGVKVGPSRSEILFQLLLRRESVVQLLLAIYPCTKYILIYDADIFKNFQFVTMTKALFG
jgi:hypothetical protein